MFHSSLPFEILLNQAHINYILDPNTGYGQPGATDDLGRGISFVNTDYDGKPAVSGRWTNPLPTTLYESF